MCKEVLQSYMSSTWLLESSDKEKSTKSSEPGGTAMLEQRDQLSGCYCGQPKLGDSRDAGFYVK